VCRARKGAVNPEYRARRNVEFLSVWKSGVFFCRKWSCAANRVCLCFQVEIVNIAILCKKKYPVSVRQLSRVFGIPESTLRWRMGGKPGGRPAGKPGVLRKKKC